MLIPRHTYSHRVPLPADVDDEFHTADAVCYRGRQSFGVRPVTESMHALCIDLLMSTDVLIVAPDPQFAYMYFKHKELGGIDGHDGPTCRMLEEFARLCACPGAHLYNATHEQSRIYVLTTAPLYSKPVSYLDVVIPA